MEKLGYLVNEADVAPAKTMAEIQGGEEYRERSKKSREELVLALFELCCSCVWAAALLLRNP